MQRQHERYAYYLRRARGYRDALAAALPLDMSSINNTADEATVLHRMRLWYFWTFLYILVVAVGVLIVVYASQTPCNICDQEDEGGSVTALKGFEGSPSIINFRKM